MDEANETGEEIVITEHGKPVSRLVPIQESPPELWGRYREKIRIVGDILSPVEAAKEWEAIGSPDRVINPRLPEGG